MNDENGNSDLMNISSLMPNSPDMMEKDVDLSTPNEKTTTASIEKSLLVEHGKRVRKNVQFLNQEYDNNLLLEKAIEIESGIGVKIAEIEKSMDGLSHVTVGKCPLLKPLHSLMFRRAGKEKEIKNNIRNFNGFSYMKKYEGDEAMLTKERAKVEIRVNNHSVDSIKTMMDILGIDRSSNSFEEGKVDKTKLIDRLVDFLEKPDPSLLVCGENKLVPKRKTPNVKVPSSRKSTAKSSEKKTKTIDEETKSKLSKMKDEKLKRPASKVSKAQRKVIKVRKVKKIAFGSASANMLTKSKPSKDKTPTEVNKKKGVKKTTQKHENVIEMEEIEEDAESHIEDKEEEENSEPVFEDEEEENMVIEENNQNEVSLPDYDSIDSQRLENDVKGVITTLKAQDEDITMRLIYSGLGKIYGKSEDEIKTKKIEIKHIVSEYMKDLE